MCSTYLKDICISCYQRLRALSRYKVTVSNLRSKITLFKAKHSSSIDAVADYGLSKICQDMLEVSVIEGDHVTILLDDELAMEINKIIFHK